MDSSSICVWRETSRVCLWQIQNSHNTIFFRLDMINYTMFFLFTCIILSTCLVYMISALMKNERNIWFTIKCSRMSGHFFWTTCWKTVNFVEIITGHELQSLLSMSHNVATVYPKKYAHGFVVLCFVVVMQSFIMNSHEVFIHIHQGCFAGTGAIVRLPQCQWSKPDGYGEISQCITTTKHSKAKTACIFLGIYCM